MGNTKIALALEHRKKSIGVVRPLPVALVNKLAGSSCEAGSLRVESSSSVL